MTERWSEQAPGLREFWDSVDSDMIYYLGRLNDEDHKAGRVDLFQWTTRKEALQTLREAFIVTERVEVD